MSRFALLLTTCLLAGCSQVTVFGHVIRDKSATVEPQTEATPAPVAAIAPALPAQVTPVAAAQTEDAPVPVAHTVKDVRLVIAPHAQDEVTGDARFNADALLEAVKAELRARKLLDVTSGATGTAEIRIDAFAVEPASNAILFGYIISNGSLVGELRLHDAGDAAPLPQRIDAGSKLSIPANGAAKNSLGPLYRRFATMTADSLAGVPSAKLDNPVENQAYR